jgi:serine protease Do
MKRWSICVIALVIGAVGGGYLVGPWLHGQNPQPAPVVFPKELTSYRDVVKRVLPAVVSIDAQHKLVSRTKGTFKGPLDPSIPDQFRRFFEDMPDVPRQGFGSGFFIDPSGVVLTNFHVVDGADSVTVTLMDGRKLTSKDIKGDRRSDLAIIRVDAKDKVPYLEFGDSDAMEIGDRVLAIGAPFGLAGSVTSGIVSAKGRNLNLNMYEDFLQTDAAINPGNSGGPLVSLEGKVIGINAAIKTKNGGFQGVGLAVASNLAKSVSEALSKDGVVKRGYLGVQIRELTPEVGQRLGLPKDTGVVLGEVFDNTPAAKAGLKAGDIVTSIAAQPVKDSKGLQATVARLPIGKEAKVELMRDGQAMTVNVNIEEQPQQFGTDRVPVPRRPQSAPDAVSLDKLGISVTDLTSSAADDLGYRSGVKGAVITEVDPSGMGAESGLRPGMLITAVAKEKVTSAAEAKAALEKARLEDGVILRVQSPQGGTTFMLLQKKS